MEKIIVEPARVRALGNIIDSDKSREDFDGYKCATYATQAIIDGEVVDCFTNLFSEYSLGLGFNRGSKELYISTDDDELISSFGLVGKCIRLVCDGSVITDFDLVGDGPVPPTPTVYINDDATTDNSSTLFGDSIALRNSGANSTSYNSNGYYTVTNTGNQKESMRVLAPLDGLSGDFILEYDSYVQGSNGSSGLVIYNSATSWEKLTDDADSNKKYWYGYNDGSFHESSFFGSTVTNQKWVHYKYTIQGNTFSMEVTYNGDTVVTHTETIHLTRTSTTQYGLDSEWQQNTVTRYKNIQAYEILE